MKRRRRRGVFGGADVAAGAPSNPLSTWRRHMLYFVPRPFVILHCGAVSTFGPVPGEAGNLAPYVC